MQKRRAILEAASALFDDAYDGRTGQDEFFRAVWVAAEVTCRPGMTTEELVRAARPLIKRSTSI